MISRASLGAMLAAAFATVITTAVVPPAVSARTNQAATPATATASASKTRMNEIQFMGAHNAYHRELQGAELAQALRMDPTYPSWGFYSHASIADLLGRQHVRAVELDLLPDPDGGLYRYPLVRKLAGLGPVEDPAMAAPGMKVMHVADLDVNSTCRTFVSCLQQVRKWSKAHPEHVPVILQLELKETDNRLEQAGGAVSPPWDRALLDGIDQEIRSVFSESQLITADDLRRPGLTLEQSILKYGWPDLDWARGKVMFFFDNGGPGTIRDMYLDGHPSLQGRAVFTRGNPGDADAAITMVNDPRGANEATIRDLVKRGYFVRTRSDEPLQSVIDEDFARVQTALASGAQMVTTDFPSVGMAARYDSDFVAELPGGRVVRCNPVSAPRNCRDDRLEPTSSR
ncbi:phosphatidylinositol-specific phospholipase C1-like protein [Nonomuraea jiangxiensis]|uniref:Phosphoinositide phospholipase C, Ca2+-dependent n=1 Tax=Nonomuraea jiangxiensis TaxID=633440 RepID=A0A1G7ZXL2_9ACTN|nr:phosphatidylinositol-specific phospholipase C1-like protein [Nonomuraea jiangxiensis]SDH13415.1 Phosphoinositide phospholipase C, Ca2+-dependent [Nonomuraea jiangxiensis]